MPQLHTTMVLGLIALLLLCPLLCGPGEVRCDLCQHEEDRSPCDSPDPCDEGSDNCICHGATLDSSVGVGPKASVNPAFLIPSLPVAVSVSAPAERFGPSSLHATPDGTTVRILIQSFLS